MSNDTLDDTIKTTSTFFKSLFLSMSLLALSSASAYAAQQDRVSDITPEEALFIQHGEFGDSLTSTDGRAVRSGEGRPLTITPATEKNWSTGDWSTPYAYMCDAPKSVCLVNVKDKGGTSLGLTFNEALAKYSDFAPNRENHWRMEIKSKFGNVLFNKMTVDLIASSGGNHDAYMKALVEYHKAGESLFQSSRECEKEISGSPACQWPEYPSIPTPGPWR